jgi:acetyl-CoA carboxylase carboxyl transferase beta subunit
MPPIFKNFFQKPKNPLEGQGKLAFSPAPSVPDEMCVSCPTCKQALFSSDLQASLNVCPKCGHHFRINARQRLNIIADPESFIEEDCAFISTDILSFPKYKAKLEASKLESAENEAVVTGTCRVGGVDCAIFVMEPYFMMGSMGTVVGEKITRLFERATSLALPVVGFIVSGGARMQEGILSLMQMAKTSGAVGRHSSAGNLYISVLTDPTTGGVTASFAMEGDIIISEPGALICFAGPRVIEQTIRQKLPQGFQRAEFLMEKGFLDMIVPRADQKNTLTTLLEMHAKEAII